MKRKIKKILKFFDLTESTVIGSREFWIQDYVELDDDYADWKKQSDTFEI